MRHIFALDEPTRVRKELLLQGLKKQIGAGKADTSGLNEKGGPSLTTSEETAFFSYR